MFYSTIKFQNISKYYKILLTNLQNCQRKETDLLLSRKASMSTIIYDSTEHMMMKSLFQARSHFVALSKLTSLEI